MVPSAKPAIKSGNEGESSKVSNHIIFHHLLLHANRKKPQLGSTIYSSYQVS